MSYIEVILQVIQFKMVHLQHPWKNTIQWVLQQQLTAKPPVLPNTWIGSLKTKVAIIKKLANWFAEQIHWLFFIWRQLSCLMSWVSEKISYLCLKQSPLSWRSVSTLMFSPLTAHTLFSTKRRISIFWKYFQGENIFLSVKKY